MARFNLTMFTPAALLNELLLKCASVCSLPFSNPLRHICPHTLTCLLRRRCTRDEFRCKDGSCISASFQCDGETDCIDESDEANCDRPMQSCPEGEFKCKGALGGMGGPGGRCVLMRFRCDGDNDCGDWSDEENCAKKQVDCMINEFKCDDGDCIPLQWRCDDKQDCNNGEDEKNCPVDRITGRTCSPDEYTCKDGRCILVSFV